jgi:hypothetical protein
MKRFPIVLKIGGMDKDTKRGFKELRTRLKKNEMSAGLTSSKLYRDGRKEFRVWINGRQNERQIVETFFHEMTHLLCRVVNFKTVNEEALCCWIGYLAKSQFGDACPRRFGRRIERRRSP